MDKFAHMAEWEIKEALEELAVLKNKHEELTQIFNGELHINKNLREELTALKKLVQEMAMILGASLKLTNHASDWAIRYEIETLNEDAVSVNAMFFADGESILDRPEVKAVMEKKP